MHGQTTLKYNNTVAVVSTL